MCLVLQLDKPEEKHVLYKGVGISHREAMH